MLAPVTGKLKGWRIGVPAGLEWHCCLSGHTVIRTSPTALTLDLSVVSQLCHWVGCLSLKGLEFSRGTELIGGRYLSVVVRMKMAPVGS